jgi:hypothetical protein
MSNIGVLSQNSVSTDSETLFLYTTNRQLISIDQQSKEEVGFDVGDILLSTFDPSTTYIAAHRSGTDQGLFLSNGSTSVFRYSINNRAWSTVGTVVGGIGAIASLETSAGVYTLVAGRSTGSGNILARTLSSFVDGASSSYTASLTVGSLTLAIPGASFRTLYPLESVIVDRMPVGSEATVSVLLDDIAGTFTNIPNPVADPPELPASSGIISKRWYLSGASIPQFARHMQIQIAFPAEANKNEVLAVTVQPQTQ